MNSGGFCERHLLKGCLLATGWKKSCQGGSTRSGWFLEQSQQWWWWYKWKDRHLPCWCITVLLATTSYDCMLQVLWETENWHIDGGAAGCPVWKGHGPMRLWMVPESCLGGTRKGKSQTAMLTSVWSPCKSISKQQSAKALQTYTSKRNSWKEVYKGATNTKKLYLYKKVHPNSCINTELH